MPNLVLIGVPDVRALERVRQKLDRASMTYACWHEPDNNLGFTSIATGPMHASEKSFLAHYRLWKPYPRVAQRIERPALAEDESLEAELVGGGSIPSPRATHP